MSEGQQTSLGARSWLYLLVSLKLLYSVEYAGIFPSAISEVTPGPPDVCLAPEEYLRPLCLHKQVQRGHTTWSPGPRLHILEPHIPGAWLVAGAPPGVAGSLGGRSVGVSLHGMCDNEGWGLCGDTMRQSVDNF